MQKCQSLHSDKMLSLYPNYLNDASVWEWIAKNLWAPKSTDLN